MILKFRQIQVLAFAFALSSLVVHETPARRKQSGRSLNDTNIMYKVSMPMPWTHLLEVQVNLRSDRMPLTTDLKMAVWTPGSYLVREYARHVQDLSVKDVAGRTLKWEKVNKNTWKIDSEGVKEIVATYKVYSNELTVRTNELNSEHAFWNNAALLMYPARQMDAPSTLEVIPFGNWKVATGLPAVAGRKNTYRAPNFDILFDSPFEVSNFKEKNFIVRNVPHRLVVTGEGNYDLDQIAMDTAKIGEEAAKIFGDLPPKDYLIILNLRGGGGLEHLNSTALQWNRFGFKPRERYIAFLNLVAHEYFHLWNVKRIRPDALGPFDYENENYTKLLWAAEGTTAYYEGVLLRRAGLVTDKEILATKASMIGQLQNRPGRFQTSLEEASVDAWIKYYRQDQNAINNQISYYDKGEIVSMLLDVRIRTLSDGTRSLDDVLRYLYEEFSKKNRNFTPSDFQAVCERMAGQSLNNFFVRYVSGREEIDYDSILGGVGLRLNVDRENERRAYLGADIAESNAVLTVRSVLAGSPAYEQGLNFNDQIVAVDGYKASNSFLSSYIGNKQPGDSIKLTVFRFDRLKEFDIRLGSDPRGDYSIVPVDSPSATQQKLYRAYMGIDLN